MNGTDWLNYTYGSGTTRNQPLSPELIDALSFLPDMGLRAQVFSGGQPAIGSGQPRVGSTRHDHGNAADLFIYDAETGRRLDWADPNDRPRFEELVRRGRQAGLTGFGAGDDYMQPGSMHIGFGTPAVWGAGGRGANAPDWLRAAYYGAEPGPTRVAGGAGDNRAVGGVSVAASAQPAPQPTSPPDNLQEAAMQQEQPRGLLGALFSNMSPEALDTLRFGLAGLGQVPNVAVQRDVMERRRERREQRATAEEQRREQATQNRTIEWLRSSGMDDLAGALMAGAPANSVMNEAIARTRGAEPQRGVVVNDRLVNPTTGAVIGDYSDPQAPDAPSPYTDAGRLAADLRSGLISEDQYKAELARLNEDDTSAAEQTIGRLMEITNPNTGQPFTREEAIQLSELYTVSRDPVTGAAQLVNKATGRIVGGGGQQPEAPAIEAPSRTPEDMGNIGGALGAGGIAANALNSLTDSVGLGLMFPQTEQGESALRNLSTQTMLALSGEWSGRPSNLTRERIEALTVKPNELFTGKGGALIKLNDMRDLVAEAARSAEAVTTGNYTPAQRTSYARIWVTRPDQAAWVSVSRAATPSVNVTPSMT